MAHNVLRIFALSITIVMGLTLNAAHAAGTGSFSGASNHVTKGSVTVTKNADGTATVTLASDFWFDGAPDPHVGFGNGGAFTKGTDVGVLQSNTGAQTYTVPAHINVDDFDEVYIWCERFAVPLGVARLN